MSASLLDVLHAIRAKLPREVNAGIGDRTGTLPPFVSLWSGPGGHDIDQSITRAGEWSEFISATCTAERADAALAVADAVIHAITPGRNPSTFRVGGAVVHAEFFDAQPVQIDRGVVLPTVDEHPAYVVTRFRVHVHPTRHT